MRSTPQNPNDYWMLRPSDEAVGEFLKRRRNYARYMVLSGRALRMIRSWSSFYGYGVDSSKSATMVTSAGQQGEIQQVAPPTYSTMVRQTERVITGTKPAFKTKATNSDVGAVVEAMMGDSLLDYYDRTLDLTKMEDEAVRSGILLAAGYVVLGWAPGAGEASVMDPDSGEVLRTGDLYGVSLTPWDVAFNPRVPELKRDWFGFRRQMNRHNLAAMARNKGNEQLADSILAAGLLRNEKDDFESFVPMALRFPYEDDQALEDLVWVWEVRHPPSPALPKGRLIRFIDAKTILYDSMEAPVRMEPELDADGVAVAGSMQDRMVADVGYPYEDVAAYEFSPEEVTGTAEPYSGHFDLLALQEVIENISTAAYSNINSGAVQNFWVPDGEDVNVESIATGLNIITSRTKPEAFSMVSVSEPMMRFQALCREWMQQAVGVSDAAMGEVKSGMPAQLAALLEAKAIQFNASGQKAYYRLVERVRTGVLLILKRFASEPRTAELIGSANEWAIKEWSNRDIANVQKVVVEPINPQMKTFAGRMAIADLMGKDLPADAKLSLILTGTLDPKLDGPKAREGRIAQNKAMLRRGIGLPPLDTAKTEEATKFAGGEFTPVFQGDFRGECIRVLPTDPVWLDIPEYWEVLESGQARADDKVVTATLDLIQECLRVWRNMSPDILALRRGPPAPTSAMALSGKVKDELSSGGGQRPPAGGPPGGAQQSGTGEVPAEFQSPQLRGENQPIRPPSQPKAPANPLDGSAMS